MAKRKSDPRRRRPKRRGATRKKKARVKKPYQQDRYIIPALRKIWRWYPPRSLALKLSLQENGLYKCARCLENHEKVQVDHIDPIGTCKRPDGRTDYNRFIDRLLCPIENLQCLCSDCHKGKTKRENSARTKLAKASKLAN